MPAITAPMFTVPEPLPTRLGYSGPATVEDAAAAIQELLDKVNELTYDVQTLHTIVAELRAYVAAQP